MSRSRRIALLATASLFIAAPAGATRSPRLEKLAPSAADATKAKDAVIRLTDLASGWKGGPVKSVDDSAPDCSWQNYSAYTITGESESDYSQGAAQIISSVQLFPNPAQALGDFRVDTRTGTAGCEGDAFRHAIGKTAKLLAAQEVAAPKVGNTAVEYRFTLKLGVNTFYANVIEFVRDRSVGGVIMVSAGEPLAGSGVLVGLIDARLQSANVA